MFEYLSKIKRAPYLFIFLLYSFYLNAQQRPEYITIADNHIYYNLDSGYYDADLKVGMPAVLVKKTVYSRRTGTMVEEIIKISDTSVAYMRYDEMLNIIDRGVLNANTKEISHIIWFAQVPDMANDPDGSKGLTKDTAVGDVPPSLKVGFWVEQDTVTIYGTHNDHKEKIYTKAGYYKNGERFGNWEYGLLYRQRKGDPEKVIQTEYIDNDHFLNFHNKIMLPPPNKETISFTGNWWAKRNSSADSIYLCRNRLINDTINYYFNFYSTHSYKSNFYSTPVDDDTQDGDWAINNGILTLNNSGSKVNYRIEKIESPASKRNFGVGNAVSNVKDSDNDGVILRKMK